MQQPHLFHEPMDIQPNAIVNVASVPQRSPFRYAGGKTWLIPRIRQWLDPAVRATARCNPQRVALFVEPFVGGGIVSLTVAAEHLADQVVMVERDEDVAAVWKTILDPEGNAWLAERIMQFQLTYESVSILLDSPPTALYERAFLTIIRNRTCHGGILAPGAGLIKHGEAGKGIASRWYPETLARRIRAIALLRDRLTFIEGDGLTVMESYAERNDTSFFIDPPYTAGNQGKRAGKRLYRYNEIDHDRLFGLAQNVRGDCLLTYDVAEEVIALAIAHRLAFFPVAMKTTHHAKMDELLIGKNLRWLIA